MLSFAHIFQKYIYDFLRMRKFFMRFEKLNRPFAETMALVYAWAHHQFKLIRLN